MRRGSSPSNSGIIPISASSAERFRTSGFDKSRILLANCLQVVVLPHHLGPSTRTAPMRSSFLTSMTSATLLRYFSITRRIIAYLAVLCNSLCHLDRFHYGIWTNFTMAFGRSYNQSFHQCPCRSHKSIVHSSFQFCQICFSDNLHTANFPFFAKKFAVLEARLKAMTKPATSCT